MSRRVLWLILLVLCVIPVGCNSTAGSGKFKDDDKPRAADRDK